MACDFPSFLSRMVNISFPFKIQDGERMSILFPLHIQVPVTGSGTSWQSLLFSCTLLSPTVLGGPGGVLELEGPCPLTFALYSIGLVTMSSFAREN